jgi:hypothetical protein
MTYFSAPNIMPESGGLPVSLVELIVAMSMVLSNEAPAMPAAGATNSILFDNLQKPPTSEQAPSIDMELFPRDQICLFCHFVLSEYSKIAQQSMEQLRMVPPIPIVNGCLNIKFNH